MAFVVHVMPVAGAEVLVAETIRRLAGELDATVFCLDAVGPLGEQLRADGVPVVSFNRRPGRDWRVAWRMAREICRRDVQLLHAQQYTPFFYSAVARVLSGCLPRLIFTEHGRHYPDAVGRLRRTLNRFVLAPLANHTTAVCEFSAGALRRLDGFDRVPVTVIENGIDPERYTHSADRQSARRRVGLQPDRIYVTNVARFHPVKDQATLLSAFRTVATARPDVDLLLAGDGPMRGDLQRQTAQLQLTERVHFLGVRRDVPAILDASDVFCLSSLSEGASLTLLEAMASALPVVVSNVGGNPEIVRHEQEGLLVERQAPAECALAILRILEDRALADRFGQAGAERVSQRYRLDQTIARYYDLYQKTLAVR